MDGRYCLHVHSKGGQEVYRSVETHMLTNYYKQFPLHNNNSNNNYIVQEQQQQKRHYLHKFIKRNCVSNLNVCHSV